jgi:hypothetical protein
MSLSSAGGAAKHMLSIQLRGRQICNSAAKPCLWACRPSSSRLLSCCFWAAGYMKCHGVTQNSPWLCPQVSLLGRVSHPIWRCGSCCNINCQSRLHAKSFNVANSQGDIAGKCNTACAPTFSIALIHVELACRAASKPLSTACPTNSLKTPATCLERRRCYPIKSGP